jgi:hypothetical protein
MKKEKVGVVEEIGEVKMKKWIINELRLMLPTFWMGWGGGEPTILFWIEIGF